MGATAANETVSPFFLSFLISFMYLWLLWVFVATRGLSLVVAALVAVCGLLIAVASLVAERGLQ